VAPEKLLGRIALPWGVDTEGSASSGNSLLKADPTRGGIPESRRAINAPDPESRPGTFVNVSGVDT